MTSYTLKFKIFTVACITHVLTPAYLSDLEPSFPFFDHMPDIWLVFCSSFEPVLVLTIPSS